MKKRLGDIDKNKVIICNLEDFLNQLNYGNIDESGVAPAVIPDSESASSTTTSV
jgi:hypothetical protein